MLCLASYVRCYASYVYLKYSEKSFKFCSYFELNEQNFIYRFHIALRIMLEHCYCL